MQPQSAERLARHSWHPWQSEPPPGRGMGLAEWLVPLLVIAVAAWFGAWWLAGIIFVVAGTLFALRRSSEVMRRRIDHGFLRLAEWLGVIATWLLLAPVFFLLMPVARLHLRLSGKDPLRIRTDAEFSGWEPADTAPRRDRWLGAMFCTERLQGRSRMGWLSLAAFGLIALLLVEGGLRVFGLGKPLLFVQDPEIGYYPAANQTVRYPGREIHTNQHGMRSAEIVTPKPTGVIRILMTGDSTLAGTRVSNDELYSARLEQILNRRAGRKIFEIHNLGVNAWGPLHQEAYIRKFGIFEADIAIICGPVANVFRPKYGLERLPFFPHTSPPRTALGHAGHEFLWRMRERTLGAPYWALEGPEQDRQAALGVKGYAGLAELFLDAGAEVHLQMLPARGSTLGQGDDPFSERHFHPIREAMEALGVAAECAGPIFTHATRKDEIYYDGIHFDRHGHALYAEHLANRLQQRSALVRRALAP